MGCYQIIVRMLYRNRKESAVYATRGTSAFGVAVREFPTSMGPVDYAFFVEGKPVGVVEATIKFLPCLLVDTISNESGKDCNLNASVRIVSCVWNEQFKI